jgi:hypothetical protein
MGKTLIVCNKCSAIFPSPIAFASRKAFDSAYLSGNVTTCPKCRSTIPCNKENMIYKD